MKIETKYDIGQHVWIVYENNGEICMYDTILTEIAIDENFGCIYYGKEGVDYTENLIVLFEDEKELIKKIKQIMEEIHKKESED